MHSLSWCKNTHYNATFVHLPTLCCWASNCQFQLSHSSFVLMSNKKLIVCFWIKVLNKCICYIWVLYPWKILDNLHPVFSQIIEVRCFIAAFQQSECSVLLYLSLIFIIVSVVRTCNPPPSLSPLFLPSDLNMWSQLYMTYFIHV